MLRVVRPLLLASTVLLSSVAGDSWAQQRERGAERAPERSMERHQRQSGALSDSVRSIERRTGGRVLSAERVPYNGRDISRLKVVDDRGRVRVYMDDPNQRRGERRRVSRDDDD
ncbi:MAG: hypothetical protein Q4F49_10350 [Pseudoxanthomonas suwonensis]|nr:hypothetical protein [Pseudoxanthomonas suwonensis]